MQPKSVDYSQLRKQVAKLYILVLTKRLSIRDALAAFPVDCEDKTIIAAWHALCHLEADEEIRARDEMYREEQDEYIELILHTLDAGEELPLNITEAYSSYHDENALIANSTKLKGIMQTIKKFICID